MRKCSYIMDITWEIRNSEVIKKDGGGMVCLNHQSAIDILGKLCRLIIKIFTISYLVNQFLWAIINLAGSQEAYLLLPLKLIRSKSVTKYSIYLSILF